MTILDTNVLSELTKPSPSSQVMQWFAAQPPLEFYTTTITQAEILCSVEMLPTGTRRSALHAAVEAIFGEDFFGRILAFDVDAALVVPKITAGRRRLGRPITQLDAQIAAIALSRGAAVATRNTSDLEHCGVAVVDPWKQV
jgi:hypothetical protein